MQTYAEFQPTGFDPAGAFLPDRQDWLVVPASRTRDSGPLDESNFEVILSDLGGESETVEVHRFGHWGPGWFELILAHPSLAEKVEGWERALEDYPVADEMDYGEREYEACMENWAGCSLEDRIEHCRNWGVSVLAARRVDELPEGFLREDLIDG